MAANTQPMANLASRQLDLLPIGICVVDRDLNLLFWNRTLAQWTGISPETATGSNLLERYPSLKSGRFLPRMKRVFEYGQPALFSASASQPFLPISLGEGGDRVMLHTTTMMPLGDHRQYAQISLTDVTTQYEQIQALRSEKEQHRRSQRRTLAILDTAADPIITISGIGLIESYNPAAERLFGYSETEVLGKNVTVLMPSPYREDINAAQTIKRNGECLLDLINDILDLSKIEAGKLGREEVDCSVHQVVAEVASLMGVRAKAKNLPLSVRFDGSIPETICTDPTRLRQILINLVGNAIKFTEAGSVQIVVCLLNGPGEEPKLQFDVIDSGIGIPADKIGKLFLPFTQVDSSTTRKFDGTVTNEAEASLHNCRILLVEDGPDNQRLIGFLLNKAGATVTLADNGRIGFDLATAAMTENRPFDVILMDMQMPVMDGYDVTGKLRETGYAGPIIALTAHAMSTDRERCLRAGCDDYLTKPLNRKKLISTVAQHASREEHCQASNAARLETQPPTVCR